MRAGDADRDRGLFCLLWSFLIQGKGFTGYQV